MSFRISNRSVAAAIAVAVAVAVYSASVSRHLVAGAFNDDAVYLALGRALSTGTGYRSIYLAGAPLQVKYPPGLPALLALLWRVGGTPARVETLAMIINVLACGVAAATLWWIGRVRLNLPGVLVATFAVLPFVLDVAVQYSTLVMSEPLFILASVLSLLFYLNTRRDRQSPSRTFDHTALGITLAAAALLRTQGIPLMLAMLLALAMDRDRRRDLSITAATALLPVIAWYAYLAIRARGAALATQSSETDYVTFLITGMPRELKTIWSNFVEYVSLVGTYVSGVAIVGRTVTIAFLLLAFVGTAMLLRRRRGIAFSVVAGFVVLVAWPVYQDRFLLPVLPLLGLVAACGAHAILIRVSPHAQSTSVRRVAAVALAAGGLLVFVRQYEIRAESARALREHQPSSVDTPSYWLPGNAWFVETVSRWAAQGTRPNDRIAVVSPAGVWLYTGRQTVPMEIVEPRNTPSVFDVPGRYLSERLVSDSVTIVVVESPGGATSREVAAVSGACPNALQVIAQFSGISALRASPGDPCVAALKARLRGRRG